MKVRLRGKTKSGKPRYRVKTVKRVIQPRFAVAYRMKGKKREVRLRYLTLNHTKPVRFTLHRVIRKGDQLAFIHTVNPKRDQLPRVRVTVTMQKPKATKKAKGATSKTATKRAVAPGA